MLLATWNVNSILARMPVVIRWLDDVKPDIVCMQETKCTDDKFPTLVFQERGYQCQLFGQASYNGVAILTRTSCETVHRGYPGDDDTAQSRLITSTVEGIDIVNVYIPNGQAVGSEKYEMKLAWMRRLRQFLDEHYDRTKPVLLCGDFNVAPEDRDVHDVRLWTGRIMFSEEERATLQHIKDWGFTDAFRLHDDAGGKFTWWDYRAGAFRRNLGLRIDHIWISEPLVSRSVRTWIDAAPRKWEKPSDHAPMVAEF
ncbi:MAG TPA: exodeoxyribonuclease III [Pyrinomonadaceae bacterium]|nr:exodeoxyribonuclease III [Pyrinomonadaceae bacterium]